MHKTTPKIETSKGCMEDKDFPLSRAKQDGRYLRLKFKDNPPYLDRIEFRFNSKWQPSYFQRGDENHPLNWPDVELAVSACFVGYLHWCKSKTPGRFLFGEKKADAGLVKKLSFAVYQTKHEIRDLFYGENSNSTDGNPDVTHKVFPAIRGLSKSGKSDTKPWVMGISRTFLPPECVEVFWGKSESRDFNKLTDVPELEELLSRLSGRPKCGISDSVGNSKVTIDTSDSDDDKYARAIRSRYGLVPIEKLDPIGTSYQPMSLTKLFVPQYSRESQEFLPPVLDYSFGNVDKFQNRNQSMGRPTISDIDLASQRYTKQTMHNVLDVIFNKSKPRKVILGSLGSGKSSLIHFVALRWAEASGVDRDNYEYPIIIELKYYTADSLD